MLTTSTKSIIPVLLMMTDPLFDSRVHFTILIRASHSLFLAIISRGEASWQDMRRERGALFPILPRVYFRSFCLLLLSFTIHSPLPKIYSVVNEWITWMSGWTMTTLGLMEDPPACGPSLLILFLCQGDLFFYIFSLYLSGLRVIPDVLSPSQTFLPASLPFFSCVTNWRQVIQNPNSCLTPRTLLPVLSLFSLSKTMGAHVINTDLIPYISHPDLIFWSCVSNTKSSKTHYPSRKNLLFRTSHTKILKTKEEENRMSYIRQEEMSRRLEVLIVELFLFTKHEIRKGGPHDHHQQQTDDDGRAQRNMDFREGTSGCS